MEKLANKANQNKIEAYQYADKLIDVLYIDYIIREDMDHVVVYDILNASSGSDGDLRAFVFGILLGILFLVIELKKRRVGAVIFIIIWLIGWVGLGSIGFGNVYYQHYKCVQAARAGDYQTVEGKITSVIKHYDRPSYEQFTVRGVSFRYSSWDLSVCGFKQMAFDGEPIEEGQRVRVAYKEGRILKLEIAQN